MAKLSQHQSLFATAGSCLVAAVLCFAPTTSSGQLRSLVNDLLAPGQTVVRSVATRIRTSQQAIVAAESSNQNQELQQLRAFVRQRDVQIHELKSRLANGAELVRFPFEVQSSPSLIVPELLKANILSHTGSEGLDAAIVIDKGRVDQISQQSLIIESTNPIIDQGTSESLKTGQPVYAGRCVVGRIEETGRWTSSLQLTTHAAYSGRARLARTTTDGLRFGEEGILEGIGNGLCRLTGIPDTQPVAVGDEVFTGGQSTILRNPMYYGRIIKADLLPGSAWDIVVKPPLDVHAMTEVVVLRATVNPIRILGQ